MRIPFRLNLMDMAVNSIGKSCFDSMGKASGYSSNFEVNDLDSVTVRELHCHSDTRSRRTTNASEIGSCIFELFPVRTSIYFYHVLQGTVG